MASNDPQLPLEGSYSTAEVDRAEFEILVQRQREGEIRLTGMQRPGKKDRWLWRVSYQLLKTSG